MGKALGDPKDPLLVSVRSGAKFSMPGMMDTILNLGLNDRSVLGLANRTGNPRFAWDCYRRFLQMFGSVVLGLEKSDFEEHLEAFKHKRRAKTDQDLTPGDLENLVDDFKALVKKRTGLHATAIRELRIGPARVQVGEPLREFHGVLTGIPQYTGEANPLLSDERAD